MGRPISKDGHQQPQLPSDRVPTIREVAAEAGVSKATVSNVIRDVRGVAPATRRRVLRVIEQLGYRPNVLARQMVQQKTNILGVVVGDIANPFPAELVKLIERDAAHRGFTTMFCSTEGNTAIELSVVETWLGYRVAGIVAVARSGPPDALAKARLHHVPVVFVACREDGFDSVSVDDVRGGQLATNHLLQLGHRSIAFLTTPTEEHSDRDRFAGFRQALAGAVGAEGHVIRWDATVNRAEVDGQMRLLREVFCASDRITGVFATNDLAAIDLLEFADRMDLRIPEHFSLVGFDDVPLAGRARISLTTVAQPREHLVRLAVDTIVARIRGTNTSPTQRILVDAELVIRGSTIPPSLAEPSAKARAGLGPGITRSAGAR